MNTSQLLKLKIKNFRSFYGEQVIDFGNGTPLVTAIYGANASGKSNIAAALRFIQAFILNSNNANITHIHYEPFLLKKDSIGQPSEFEIEFTHRKRHFIYGFSVTRDKVVSEYFREFASSTKKPRTIFKRSSSSLNASAEKYSFGKKLFENTRPTSLLITKARENNNEYANILFEWLNSFNVLNGKEDETMQWSITQLRNNPQLHEPVLDLLKKADLWIRSFKLEDAKLPLDIIHQLPFNNEVKEQLMSPTNPGSVVMTSHAVRDKDQKIIGEQLFELGSQESSGTQKFFQLATPLIDTLANGKVLYIDEFGSHLHPDMCRFIVYLFKSSRNKHKAQLIVNTHDTSLMSQTSLLKREDIVFIEKNLAEESIVSPLAKKSVRPSESFEKRYRQGLYGAKPLIDTEE